MNCCNSSPTSKASATTRRQKAMNESEKNYLSAGDTVKSWLLTTDHKRIGILFLVSILFFFFIAACAAAMMRLELLTPQGDLVLSETYNKLFTIHGVLMVWFFLIPSIPSVLGNFLVPLMIGARDVAFPKLNLLSWYLFMHRRIFCVPCDHSWRRGHRLDFLHALQQRLFELARHRNGGGNFHRRLRLDSDRTEFHHHHPKNARARLDVVSPAAFHLVDVFDEHHPRSRHARVGDHACC